jgi:hypothetical protein
LILHQHENSFIADDGARRELFETLLAESRCERGAAPVAIALFALDGLLLAECPFYQWHFLVRIGNIMDSLAFTPSALYGPSSMRQIATRRIAAERWPTVVQKNKDGF